MAGGRATHSHAPREFEPDCFVGMDLGNWMRAPAGFHARYAKEPLRGLVLEDRAASGTRSTTEGKPRPI